MTPSHLRWRFVTTVCCLVVAIITMINAFDPYGLFTVKYSWNSSNNDTGGSGEYFYFRGQLLACPLSEDGSWQNIIHLAAIHARYFLGTLYGVLSLFLVAYLIEDLVLLLTYKEKEPGRLKPGLSV